MDNQPIQVLVVDDQAIIRKSIKALLNGYEDIYAIGEAANGLQAVELVERLKPDVVLIDLIMPDMDGIEVIKRIKVIQPRQCIIALTDREDEDRLLQSIQAGTTGYLLKEANSEELIFFIRFAYRGYTLFSSIIPYMLLRDSSSTKPTKPPAVKLSKRELDVLSLLTQGNTDKQIAEQLVIAEMSVRTHVSRIKAKLGVRNRVQAALYAIQSSVVQLPGIN
jgi:two-component system, NarL family, response regulator LiaR